MTIPTPHHRLVVHKDKGANPIGTLPCLMPRAGTAPIATGVGLHIQGFDSDHAGHAPISVRAEGA